MPLLNKMHIVKGKAILFLFGKNHKAKRMTTIVNVCPKRVISKKKLFVKLFLRFSITEKTQLSIKEI